MFYRLALSSILALSCATSAFSQTPNERVSALQDALNANEVDLAMDLASALYADSDRRDDHQTAGFSAYVMAGLFKQKNEHLQAAETFEDCADHYGEIGSIAQSIQCDYQAGKSFMDGLRKGQAVSLFKSVAKQLEDIGQDRSALASELYLTLAEETLPPKSQRGRRAHKDRLEAADYAEKSRLALKATGQDRTQIYSAALFMKGLALEDAEMFEEAAEAYAEAVTLYQSLPDHDEADLRNMTTRLNIAQADGEDTQDNYIDVKDIDGETVNLTINKKRRVKFPRVNKNQLVDGARARVVISLTDSGEVDDVTIIESIPSEEFGQALEKAVRSWTFRRTDDGAISDIPPFEYGLVFYVKRL
ncbi:MAG: energy transducer TonB [Pseudomonadota bacterium]